MGSDWPAVTIGELVDGGRVELQTGPFGTQLHAHDYVEDGVPVVPTEALRNRQIDYSVLPRISQDKAMELVRHRLEPGDILFARRGVQATGHIGYVREAEDGFICGTGAIRLRVRKNDGVLSPEFLSHVLADPLSVEWFKFHAIGATMPNLNEGIIRSFRFLLPPLDVQRRIAAMLGALDDKIELNRRMSRTLDALAAAVFDDRFVGFSRETGPFTESPLGPVPAGWSVSTLGAVCRKPQYGYTETASRSVVGPHFLRITDINKEPWIRWDTVPYCPCTPVDTEKYGLRRGDVVVARMADPGHGAYIEEDVEAVFASYLIRFRPRDAFMGRYLQYWLRSRSYWDLVRARQGGSTRANLNAKMLAEFPILVPRQSLLVEFSAIVDALRNRLCLAIGESERLAELRDALLPRLLDGRLAVGNA